MYKKVLVPLDGSELAECALNHVKNLFKEGSIGEITLLSVVKVGFPWDEMYDWDEMQNKHKHINLNAIRDALFATAGKYLAAVSARLGSEGIKVKTEAHEGNRPADTILEYARNNGMDMIVIATHGYTGLKKLMFGSVAYGVLHDSPVPVFLIRPESCRA